VLEETRKKLRERLPRTEERVLNALERRLEWIGQNIRHLIDERPK
jgi:hypothetical protein